MPHIKHLPKLKEASKNPRSKAAENYYGEKPCQQSHMEQATES